MLPRDRFLREVRRDLRAGEAEINALLTGCGDHRRHEVEPCFRPPPRRLLAGFLRADGGAAATVVPRHRLVSRCVDRDRPRCLVNDPAGTRGHRCSIILRIRGWKANTGARCRPPAPADDEPPARGRKRPLGRVSRSRILRSADGYTSCGTACVCVLDGECPSSPLHCTHPGYCNAASFRRYYA